MGRGRHIGAGGYGAGGLQPGFGHAGERMVQRWNAQRTRAFQALAAREEAVPRPLPQQPVAGLPEVEWLCIFPADHPVRQILYPPMLGFRMEWQGWYRNPEVVPDGGLSQQEQDSVLDLAIVWTTPGEVPFPPPPTRPCP